MVGSVDGEGVEDWSVDGASGLSNGDDGAKARAGTDDAFNG